MKAFRIILVTLIVASLTVALVARTRLLARTNSSTLTAPVPASGIAIIDSGEFAQEKTGITRVSSALTQVEAKYTGVRKDLGDMRTRLSTLRSDIEKKRQIQDAK